ncbi:hypothetical protein HSBAA_13120 [Vreelandella sulfidaeris]|uniref:Uncharacterized protein n=1 Tax=Vreelandella sulfidaeris TaxID=115553 RepID=A0A455U203_9GAMM|nr:hypothetical protein HSBAA_13120 [Halomonas sulfidaeris]
MVLLRPLAVLELDDASAKSLGVSLTYLRFAGMGLAVFITGSVVSVVGIIGFIGLAAPNIVRMAGARRLGATVTLVNPIRGRTVGHDGSIAAAVFGHDGSLYSYGAITGALGAPLLMWLIPRLKLQGDKPPQGGRCFRPSSSCAFAPGCWLTTSATGATVLGLLFGQGVDGWYWLAPDNWNVMQWRMPRVMAAAASGLMLAIAGTILQRLSANPMASPEVLGISGGCAIALILGFSCCPPPPI